MRNLFGTICVGRERRCQSRRARAYIAYNTCLICIYCGGTNPTICAGAWLSASCASSEDEVASELATAPWVAELPEHPGAICGMLLARTRWGTWVWGHTILQLSAATLYNDSFWVSVLCWFFLHCESINFIQIRLGPQSRGQVRVKIFLQWKRTLLRRWICFSIAKWKSIDEIDENNIFGVAAAIKGGFGDWSRTRRVSHTLRDNLGHLGLFGSRWMPRFFVYIPRAMEPISKIQLLAQVAQHDRVAIRISNVGWGPARPMGLWTFTRATRDASRRLICVDHAFLQTIWMFSEVLQPCGDRERRFPGARHTRNHPESACKGGVSVRGEVNSDCKNPW